VCQWAPGGKVSDPDDRWQQWRQRFADQPKVLEILDKLDAQIAALGAINDATLAAVRDLETQETQLKQRFVNGEISQAEYLQLWSDLLDRTPHEVQLAAIKLMQTMIEALRPGPQAPDA
jgi:hypothetical protein